MKYYITSDGELRHAAPNRGWEKDDHKYVKREWKSNRWVYTYPSDTKKDTKAKTNLADTVRKVTSTARELDAKKKLENRGKLSLEARAALTRGRNAVNNKPWVSKEYLEEVAYNSQKNDGSSGKSETKKQTNTNSGTKKPTTSANVSKEYLEEVAYNSQKNQYPTTKSSTSNKTSTASTTNRGKAAIGNLARNAVEKVVSDARSTDLSKPLAKAHNAATEYTNKNYMKLVTDTAKGMVKGNSKVADALTSYKAYADKAAMLAKVADNAAKNMVNAAQNDNTSNMARELAEVRLDAMKASRAMQDAASKLGDAVKESTADRILDEHSAYEKERFFERYGSNTGNAYRSMAQYYDDMERQIREGTYADPNATSKEKDEYRSFSVDGLVKGIQDWFGKPEAETLNKASSEANRANSQWKSAKEQAEYYEEQYDRLVDMVKQGNTAVTVSELNSAYDRWAEADDRRSMEFSRYMARQAAYEQALDSYLKTPAGDLEKRYDSFIDSAGDSIDSGKDWVEDRLEDLADWWDDLRR